MPAAMGTRTCPELGCQRAIYVSAGGTVYARCIAHTLIRLSGAFATPPTPRDAPRTPATRSGLTSAHRGRPDAALTASPGR
jgi:hypothetical protein